MLFKDPDLGTKIVETLGLDPSKVAKLSIHIAPADLFRVDIRWSPSVEEYEAVAALLTTGYKLVANRDGASYQDRVRSEKQDLDDKLSKLRDFQNTRVFAGLSVEEQARLYTQCGLMGEYSKILGERIAAFTEGL